MKKFICSFIMVIFLTPLSYADFAWHSQTRTHLSTRLKDSDKEYTSKNGGAYVILYNTKFNRFNEIDPDVIVLENGKYLQIDFEGEYKGQCVSFVKAVANVDKTTSSWKPVKQVGVDEIKVGRVIALMDSSGKYPQGNAQKHVGIYIGQDSDGIWMLDQNWAPNIVGIHKIKFGSIPNNGPGKGDGNKHNAYSYFTIK